MQYESPKVTLETQEKAKEKQFLNPWEFVEPVIRNIWFILLIMCMGVLGAVLYNVRATPIFRAQSSIIVRRNFQGDLLRNQRTGDLSPAINFTEFTTILKLINSTEFAEKLVVRLIEAGHFTNMIPASDFENLPREDRDMIIRGLANRVRGGIAVDNPKMTNIVEIAFTSDKPELARDVVNIMADVVVEHSIQEQRLASERSMGFLEEKLEESSAKVIEAERQLYDFRVKNNIFEQDLDKKILANRKARLMEGLSAARSSRLELESRIRELDKLLQRRDFTRYTTVMPAHNETLSSLEKQLVQAEVTYKNQLNLFTERHPEVIHSRQQVETLRDKFRQELIKTRTKFEYDLNVAKDAERHMEEELASLQSQAISSTETDIELAVLERMADSENELYKTLLQAIKEVSVNNNSSVSNIIYVHEKSMLPKVPIKPKKQLNLIIGLFMGITLGVMFAYGREFLDATIRNPEDVERLTGLSVLSTIPMHIKKKDEPERSVILIKNHPKSLFSESVASLRSHLNIKLPQDGPVAMVVTSSSPKEGKSIIAANLASSMSLDGRRTVLVDADLHRPTVHKTFDVDKKGGLFDLIVDALNPRWGEIDMSTVNFGDLRHLIRLKQWSGTLRIKWDSLDMPLSIGFDEGKAVGSNLDPWRQRFNRPEGFPSPGVPEYHLDEGEIFEDSTHQSGKDALDFIRQYPKLQSPHYFIENIVKNYVKDTELENLQIITAGTKPKNPNEILGSEQMSILIEILKQRYDRIVIDCPPAWPLSDVSVLSPKTDGILWICRASETPRSLFTRNIEQIRAIQPKILGVVINGVDLRRDRYYYYGYSYYYYRYYKSDYYKDLSSELGKGSSRKKKSSSKSQ